jgi:signal transduction histidine kinase
VSLAGIALVSVVLNIIYKGVFFSLLLSLGIYFGICVTIFKGKVQSRLLASVFFMIFSLFSELLAAALISLIFGDIVIEARENSYYMFLGGISSRLVLLILIRTIIYNRHKKKWQISNKSWLIIMTIPLISIAMSIISVYGPIVEKRFGIMQVLFCLLLLYINIITFYMFDNIVVQMADIGQYKLREHMLLMNQEQYEAKMETYEQVRRIRHDMIGHLVAIRGYHIKKNFDEALEYIDQLHEQISATGNAIISGNTVVDALINNRIVLMEQKGIECHQTVVIPDELKIEDMDLAIVVENMINNAIEGCERSGKEVREITLGMKYKNQNLFIEVKNTYDPDQIRKSKGKFMSTKEKIENHGIGIGNIEETVEKYNGLFQVELQEYYFVAKAMIPDKIV